MNIRLTIVLTVVFLMGCLIGEKSASPKKEYFLITWKEGESVMASIRANDDTIGLPIFWGYDFPKNATVTITKEQ